MVRRVRSVYVPENPPSEVPSAIAAYVMRELRRVSSAEPFNYHIPVRNSPPERPRNGLVVIADGFNWDPGEGSGLYVRIENSWILIANTTRSLTLTSGSLTLTGKTWAAVTA